MKETERTVERQVAILIDFENVGLDSVQWLFDQMADVGRIIVKRAYADWSVASHTQDKLLEFGIEPIHLFRSSGGGKNSSDIRLAIDAIELLYLSPVDTFVIVSSDSDFVPLISKLRAAGKTVFGAGDVVKALPTLVKSCDRYLYLDKKKNGNTNKSKPSQDNNQEVYALIKRAVTASMDEKGRVVGSKLHQTMLRLDPGFDYHSRGYATFTKYLEDSIKEYPELKLVRPKGGDLIIELAEGAK